MCVRERESVCVWVRERGRVYVCECAREIVSGRKNQAGAL